MLFVQIASLVALTRGAGEVQCAVQCFVTMKNCVQKTPTAPGFAMCQDAEDHCLEGCRPGAQTPAPSAAGMLENQDKCEQCFTSLKMCIGRLENHNDEKERASQCTKSKWKFACDNHCAQETRSPTARPTRPESLMAPQSTTMKPKTTTMEPKTTAQTTPKSTTLNPFEPLTTAVCVPKQQANTKEIWNTIKLACLTGLAAGQPALCNPQTPPVECRASVGKDGVHLDKLATYVFSRYYATVAETCEPSVAYLTKTPSYKECVYPGSQKTNSVEAVWPGAAPAFEE